MSVRRFAYLSCAVCGGNADVRVMRATPSGNEMATFRCEQCWETEQSYFPGGRHVTAVDAITTEQ